jgi:uncharacterized membrane protein YcaP (DUF421 family)
MFGLPDSLVVSQRIIYRTVLFVLEKSLRPFLVYLFLAVMLRWFGKRVLAQLNPFDLVVYLSLANIVQNALIGDDNSVTGGLIGASALLLINNVVVRFVFEHRILERFFRNKPTVLIEHGRVRRKNLARQHLTESEMLTAAHRQGYSNLKEIEHCELDSGGAFFIQGKPQKRADVEDMLSEIIERLDELNRQVAELRR